jgi:hypothetical protein
MGLEVHGLVAGDEACGEEQLLWDHFLGACAGDAPRRRGFGSSVPARSAMAVLGSTRHTPDTAPISCRPAPIPMEARLPLRH